MKKTLSVLAVATLLTLLLAGYSFAAGEDEYVKEGFIKGVKYMSGGVGVEERTAMEQMDREFNLKLVFAEPDGKYIAGIQVAIKRPGRRELYLDAKSNGPWFYARLPKGIYEITATYNNLERTQKVTLGTEQKTVRFWWK